MNEFIDAGSQNVSVALQFLDTTGNPVQVMAATPNLVISAWRQGASNIIFFDDASVPPISDLPQMDSPHTPGGIFEFQDGMHRFDLTDAVVAAGVSRVYMTGRATGIVMIPLVIFLAPGPAVVDVAPESTAAIADRILLRNQRGGSDTGRTVSDSLLGARNRVAIVAGEETTYEADDTTPAFTRAATTAPGNPLVELNPSG